MDIAENSSGYNSLVLDHFRNPRNCGELPDADCVGAVRHGRCGDYIKLFLKIEGERIIDARFKTYGCGVAIASSSALTELLRGKTIAEARKLRNSDVVQYLGGLPAEKIACSEFAEEVIAVALGDMTKKG
jgi:NifU-like protein involved in Fe-S cluster formation